MNETWLRFWTKVSLGDDCWLWMAGTNGRGYGHFTADRRNGKQNLVLAHRWAWEDQVGPCPQGLEPDHLCRVKLCVRPDHLEWVTHKENLMRADGWGALNARKTHCPQDHEYTPENIYSPPGTKYRHCVICRREWSSKRARRGQKTT